VGKTTACHNLETLLPNSEAIYERFDENPYLPLFYQELKKKPTGYNKFSYQTQVTFLNLRAQREIELQNKDKCYIVDRSLLEDRYIFGQCHIDDGLMNAQEILQYCEMFKVHLNTIDKPEVIVFLRADVDVLLDRIKKRGRGMESGISKEYLAKLQTLYDETLIPIIEKEYPEILLLKYDTDTYDEDKVMGEITDDLSNSNSGDKKKASPDMVEVKGS
jgi:deoxyadenosine/deoxycytidine kinase